MDEYDGETDIKVRARAQFSALTDVWPNNDTWSRHTHTEISRRLHRHCERIIPKSGHSRLLNIGSHGNNYGIVANEHIHIDLAADALIGVPLAAAADAELLPISSSSIDVAICVGSVINYSSPPKILSEISRILKPLGYLLLEFETSDSFEFALTNAMLIKAIVRAHQWFEMLKSRTVQSITDIAKAEHLPRTYVSSVIPFALLAPDVIEAILEGTQPFDLNLDRLINAPLPLDWAEQRSVFGFK